MATIREKRNRWHVQIRRKGYPPQSATFDTQREAEEWATTIEAEMIRGVFVDRTEAQTTTLNAALERYEREVSRKKDGYAQERVRINTWKKSPLAKRTLANLRGSDFASWRDTRLESVTPATVRNDLAVISHLYRVAKKEWGMAVTNPIADIELPTEDNSRDRRLEGDEEYLLIEELVPVNGRSPWMIPLVQLAIETAARRSELLALKWVDVDLKRRTIRITGKERSRGKQHTKNKVKYRDIPITPKAHAILTSLPRDISGKVLPIGSGVVGHAFSSACKRARDAYVRECKKRKEKPDPKKLIDLTFHDLRHEGTSRLAEIFQIHELMKITGHKDTRQLARYYHPKAEDLAKKLWA